MCDQLKDVPEDEWEALKQDVKDLKDNQHAILEERATMKGWLRGWMFGISLFFIFAQIVGGIIINRAMNIPEENSKAIHDLKESTAHQISSMLQILEANNVADKNHHNDENLHMPDRIKRQEFVPRSELTLTLSGMEQRNAQLRDDVYRQFSTMKEQLIKLDMASETRASKMEAKLDRILELKLKDGP